MLDEKSLLLLVSGVWEERGLSHVLCGAQSILQRCADFRTQLVLRLDVCSKHCMFVATYGSECEVKRLSIEK